MLNDIYNLKIGVIGNCYFDEVYRIGKYPNPDDKITALDMKVTLGGSATNTSVGLVKLGFTPNLISVIGDDRSGALISEELQIRGIRPDHLVKIQGQTGRTIILLDENMNSTKIGYPGVSRNLITVIEKSNIFSEPFDLVHLASVDLKTATHVAEKTTFTYLSLDFGARTLEASDEEIFEFLPKLNLAFFNRNVFRRLFPQNELSVKSLENIHLPCDMVLTAGDGGIYAKIGDKVFYHPIFRVEVVDTTGAGDAAAATVIWGFLQKLNWNKTLQYASANAAIKLTSYGASNGHSSVREIEDFILKQSSSSSSI